MMPGMPPEDAGRDMAKKRISSVDLSWLISEKLFDSRTRAARIAGRGRR